MKRIKILFSFIALLSSFTLFGCNNNDQKYVSPTISLSETRIELIEGRTYQLVATTSETSMIIYWFTRDMNIATVDNNGIVTALSSGNTICYAQVGENTAMCSVNVLPYHPDDSLYVTTNVDIIELNVGDVYKLPIEVKYGDSIITDYSLRADIERADICSYSQGYITALGEGETLVLVTVSYLDSFCQILFTVFIA